MSTPNLVNDTGVSILFFERPSNYGNNFRTRLEPVPNSAIFVSIDDRELC